MRRNESVEGLIPRCIIYNPSSKEKASKFGDVEGWRSANITKHVLLAFSTLIVSSYLFFLSIYR
jgi:hypothetical protein